jgi:hypothetical protein
MQVRLNGLDVICLILAPGLCYSNSVSAQEVGPAACNWLVEAQHLEKMAAADQDFRNAQFEFFESIQPGLGTATRVEIKDPELIKKSSQYSDAIEALDTQNQQQLSALVHRCGWPKAAIAGADAVSAAWLIVQHAPLAYKIEHQNHIFDSYKTGDIAGVQYAKFVDRVLVRSGKPQRYGTQLIAGSGGSTLGLIEDEAKLEQRRKEIGLPTVCAQLENIEGLDTDTANRCK